MYMHFTGKQLCFFAAFPDTKSSGSFSSSETIAVVFYYNYLHNYT